MSNPPEKVVYIFTPRNGAAFKFRCAENAKTVLNYLKKVLRLKNDAQVRAAGSWAIADGSVTATSRADVRAAKRAEQSEGRPAIATFHFTPGDGRPAFEFRAPNHEAAVYGYLIRRGFDVKAGKLSEVFASDRPSPRVPDVMAPSAPNTPPPRPAPKKKAARARADQFGTAPKKAAHRSGTPSRKGRGG